jgi:hypothetical protein
MRLIELCKIKISSSEGGQSEWETIATAPLYHTLSIHKHLYHTLLTQFPIRQAASQNLWEGSTSDVRPLHTSLKNNVLTWS